MFSERAPVAIGTERDLVGLDPVDLAVAVDADGLLFGDNYRNSEEALRVLARLGDSLVRASGRRMIVQTSMPDSELMSALKRGKSVPYLEGLLVERAREFFPPAAEMLALEIRGEEIPESVDLDVKGLSGPTVLGPADIRGGRSPVPTSCARPELAGCRVDGADRRRPD